MTVADIIQGLRAMEARNAALEAENGVLRTQVSAAVGDPTAAPVLNANGLRACPFCGPTAKVMVRRGRNWPGVYCSSCGATTGTHYTEPAAIAAWNTRR